jgi:hypothetical protein
MRPVVMAALLVVGCNRVHAKSELERLRESARATLRTNCGECHIRSRPTALREALAVFDLDEPEWAARMSNQQLDNTAERLDSDIVPTQGKEESRPNRATPDERKRFREYLLLERERRAAVRPAPSRVTPNKP